VAVKTFVETAAELNALFCAVFTGTWSTVAQNAGAPATNLYFSLHNANPGAAGSQTTNETAYTNYTRIAVARTTGGFTVTTGSGTTFSNVANAASVIFPTCGTTGDTLTHWGLGLSSAGAGTLLAYGPLAPAGAPVSFECTNASPGVLTHFGYTPVVNDRVSVYQLPGAEGLPTGLTEGTVYFIGTAPGGQTSTLSTTTANGTPVNTTSTGQGYIYKMGLLVVNSGIAPTVNAGAAVIQYG
jgi:hypothetical protein